MKNFCSFIAPSGMKYLHIYFVMFLTIFIVFFLDSVMVSRVVPYSQWLANLVMLITFCWMLKQVTTKIKKLMLYGLSIGFVGESFFALVLGMYTYRLENLPLYVPIGHSIVYAGVFYIVKEPLFKKYQTAICQALYFAMIMYSTLWLFFANDVFGFLCMLVILYVLNRHEDMKPFFLSMFFFVIYIELIGTYFQCWVWPEVWFNRFTFIPSANPPSGIAAFYFIFDGACLLHYKTANPLEWYRLKRFQVRKSYIQIS